MWFYKRLVAMLAMLTMIIASPECILAQTYYTETGHVEFHSDVPTHSFTGQSNQLVGKITLADSTVDFYVDVHTLDTGIGMRDDDMLETLEAEQYPFAEFYGKLISDFNSGSGKPQTATVKGNFKVHGVSNAVTIKGTLQKTSKGLKLTASWSLNMEDYNIKPPGILFYRVSEIIDISIEALLPPNK